MKTLWLTLVALTGSCKHQSTVESEAVLRSGPLSECVTTNAKHGDVSFCLNGEVLTICAETGCLQVRVERL